MIGENSVDLADLVVGRILNLYIASSIWCESIGLRVRADSGVCLFLHDRLPTLEAFIVHGASQSMSLWAHTLNLYELNDTITTAKAENLRSLDQTQGAGLSAMDEYDVNV